MQRFSSQFAVHVIKGKRKKKESGAENRIEEEEEEEEEKEGEQKKILDNTSVPSSHFCALPHPPTIHTQLYYSTTTPVWQR